MEFKVKPLNIVKNHNTGVRGLAEILPVSVPLNPSEARALPSEPAGNP